MWAAAPNRGVRRPEHDDRIQDIEPRPVAPDYPGRTVIRAGRASPTWRPWSTLRPGETPSPPCGGHARAHEIWPRPSPVKATGVSHQTVARLLQASGYNQQVNRKNREGDSHPDRDAQFEYIAKQVRSFQRRGQPVVSVDTKKKELGFIRGNRCAALVMTQPDVR